MPEFTYKVAMTCGGCSGAVTRILQKNPDIENFNVSLETKLVTVNSSKLSQEEIFEIIKKSGKATEYIAASSNSRSLAIFNPKNKEQSFNIWKIPEKSMEAKNFRSLSEMETGFPLTSCRKSGIEPLNFNRDNTIIASTYRDSQNYNSIFSNSSLCPSWQVNALTAINNVNYVPLSEFEYDEHSRSSYNHFYEFELLESKILSSKPNAFGSRRLIRLANHIIYSQILDGASKNYRFSLVFNQYLKEGFRVTGDILSLMGRLASLGSDLEIQSYLSLMSRTHFPIDQFFIYKIIKVAYHDKDPEGAEKLFNRLHHRNDAARALHVNIVAEAMINTQYKGLTRFLNENKDVIQPFVSLAKNFKESKTWDRELEMGEFDKIKAEFKTYLNDQNASLANHLLNCLCQFAYKTHASKHDFTGLASLLFAKIRAEKLHIYKATYLSLMSLFSKSGNAFQCRSVLKTIKRRAAVLEANHYELVARAYSSKGSVKLALKVVDEMMEEKIRPTAGIMNAIIQTFLCQTRANFDKAVDVLKIFLGLPVDPNIETFVIFETAFSKFPHLGNPYVLVWKKLLDESMIPANVYTLNILMRYELGLGRYVKVVRLFKELREGHISPNAETFEVFLKALKSLKRYDEILKIWGSLRNAQNSPTSCLIAISTLGLTLKQRSKEEVFILMRRIRNCLIEGRFEKEKIGVGVGKYTLLQLELGRQKDVVEDLILFYQLRIQVPSNVMNEVFRACNPQIQRALEILFPHQTKINMRAIIAVGRTNGDKCHDQLIKNHSIQLESNRAHAKQN